MFFPRLRRHAKWMFVFLALVFGLGFVGFGVGAGGVGVGDVFRGGGGGGPSVESAREKTEENPKNAAAWEELSQALQAEGDNAEAIQAQQQLVALRPKDPNALRTLAALQLTIISEKQTQAQIIQGNAAINAAGPELPVVHGRRPDGARRPDRTGDQRRGEREGAGADRRGAGRSHRGGRRLQAARRAAAQRPERATRARTGGAADGRLRNRDRGLRALPRARTG